MRSILIDGISRPVRLSDFEMVEAARQGEVGMGGFDADSENAGYIFNAHKTISIVDLAAGSNVFTGFIADKDISRGPFSVQNDRQFGTGMVDLNTMLIDDIMTGSAANRPEETDIARVQWLVGTSFLNGMGSTIGASGATTLEASDYRTQEPLALLTQAAETSGKLFFVYWDLATAAPKLFYDVATASNFITPHKISTYLPDGSNSTTHHPVKDSLTRRLDGGRIYSELLFKYDGGSVTVTNTATASNFKSRKTVLYDNTVKTSAMATRKANRYLTNASTEEETIMVDVLVNDEDALCFRAGQLMQIKAPHLGLPTFTDRRIVRTSKKPRTETDEEGYLISMELSLPTSSRWGARGSPIDTLPDSVANPAGTPADTEDVGCDTPSQTSLEYEDSHSFGGDGVGVKAFGGSAYVTSTVYYNVAWPVAGCPIGGGGWVGWHDEEQWFTYTAPADDPKYLGTVVTIDASAVGFTGPLTFPFDIRAASGAVTSGRFGDGAGIGSITAGSSATFYVPRSLVDWGGTNSIIIAPSWQCERGAFFCDPAAIFNGPDYFGWGNSASASGFSVSDVCVRQFTAGTTGSSGWVAGLGDVDGLNDTFTLIDWAGSGSVEVSVNGLIQPNAEVTLDTGALTATIPPPPENAIVLFLYTVTA